MGGNGTRERVRAAGLAALLGISLGIARPTPAHAAIISTSSLEAVVAASSHVALGTWDPKTRRFTVERWLRGDWPEPEIELQGTPVTIAAWMGGRDRAISSRFVTHQGDTPVRLGNRAIFFLEALDGRLHVTGYRRYGPEISSHASIRHVTPHGRVVAYRQTMNPGPPVPVDAEAPTIDEFLPLLEGVIGKHPYEPPTVRRPAIPPAYRAAFFTALGPTIDWYEGDWPTTYPGFGSLVSESKDVEAAAERLFAWAESVPREARLPALEAILMLCTVIQGGGPDRTPVVALAHRLLPDVDPEAALAWILRDVRHGGYYTNREELGRLARDLGPIAEEKTFVELEQTVLDSVGSLPTSAYWALKRLGQGERAEAALARQQASAANPPPGK